MILLKTQILKAREAGDIIIEPWFPDLFLGPNSYDVHLSPILATYQDDILDARKENPLDFHIIHQEKGFLLLPNKLYLGSTLEHTVTNNYVPEIDGISSTARLGIDIHKTAARGNMGFGGTWTLEITVAQPVRIYAGMPIGQLTYFKPDGDVNDPVNKKETNSYAGQVGLPVGSQMFKKVIPPQELETFLEKQIEEFKKQLA